MRTASDLLASKIENQMNWLIFFEGSKMFVKLLCYRGGRTKVERCAHPLISLDNLFSCSATSMASQRVYLLYNPNR